MTVIGETTIDEYRKQIEPDHAFSQRFEVLQINEPDIASVILMMQSVLSRYMDFHKLEVTKEAIEECVKLAKCYDKDCRLLDSAIDLMDRTISATKKVNETASKDIHQLISELAIMESAFKKHQKKSWQIYAFCIYLYKID